VGRADCWPENYRSNRPKTHESGFARNPVRKICARIYSRNEERPAALCEVAARSGKAPHRKSRRAIAPPDELENRNKNSLSGGLAELWSSQPATINPKRLQRQSAQRKCSKRRRLRRALASSLRLPPAAASFSYIATADSHFESSSKRRAALNPAL
jgi:hypothetical protein